MSELRLRRQRLPLRPGTLGGIVTQVLNIALVMVNGLGQMALVAVFYGIIKRFNIGRNIRSVALGVLFGSGAIFAMMNSVELASGMRIDPRAIIVGLAGAFAGVPSGLIAAALATAYRCWLGGAGVPFGVIGIAIATVAGIAWAKLLPRHRRDRISGLVVLGIAIACYSLPSLFGKWINPQFISIYLPMVWGTCLVATLTLGWMMQRENGLILREKSLADFAYTDPLTGLANRRAFDRRMLNGDVHEPGARYTLVMIDVDHFKTINDRFGHEAGDEVLRGLARTIQDDIRDNDLVARFGGEEFVVLLPGTDLVTARLTAERIRARIAAQTFDYSGGKVRVTASFGLVASAAGIDLKSLIAAADTALYAAKAKGRNRVEAAPLWPAPASGSGVPQPAAVAPAM